MDTAGAEGGGEGGPGTGQEGDQMRDVDTIADQVEQTMASLINRDLVNVRRGEQWLEVDFKAACCSAVAEPGLREMRCR